MADDFGRSQLAADVDTASGFVEEQNVRLLMEQPRKDQLLLIAPERLQAVSSGLPPLLRHVPSAHELDGVVTLPEPTEACTGSETSHGDVVGGREGQGQALLFPIFTQVSDSVSIDFKGVNAFGNCFSPRTSTSPEWPIRGRKERGPCRSFRSQSVPLCLISRPDAAEASITENRRHLEIPDLQYQFAGCSRLARRKEVLNRSSYHQGDQALLRGQVSSPVETLRPSLQNRASIRNLAHLVEKVADIDNADALVA